MVKSYNSPQEQPVTSKRPPLAEERIIEVITRIKSRNGRVPEMFPNSPYDIAQFWINHQEGEGERDRPEWIYNTRSDDGGAWQVPYVDRVVSNLKIFIKLNKTEQYFVIKNIDDGYLWRGDSIDLYIEIIKNTDLMHNAITRLGRDEHNRLPLEYTREVLRAVYATASDMAELPYNKNERLA